MNLNNKLKIALSLIVLAGSTQAQNLDEAMSLYHQSKDQQALALFQKIDSADSKMYQAEIQMNLDLDEAEDIIEAAAKAHPEHAGIQYWRGRIMGEQAGNAIFSAMSYAKKSLSSFKKAAELEPGNPEYLTGVMMFYLNAPSFVGGDQEKALDIVKILEKLDQEEGANARIRYIRATEKKKTTEVMQAVTKAHPNYASLEFQLAQWYQRQEQYEVAFESYNKALAKIGEDEAELKCSIWYQQAKTTVLSKTEYVQGEQAINQYIEHCEISRGMPDKDWAAFRSANIMEMNGKSEEAKRVYKMLKSTSDQELQEQLKKKV